MTDPPTTVTRAAIATHPARTEVADHLASLVLSRGVGGAAVERGAVVSSTSNDAQTFMHH